MEKKCSKCREVKNASEFHKRASSKDGLDSACRVCAKEYRDSHREQRRASKKLWDERNRDHVKEYNEVYSAKHRTKLNINRKEKYYANLDEGRLDGREQYWKHREKRIAYGIEYRENNREKINANARNRYSNNKEVILEKHKIWLEEHKEEQRNKENERHRKNKDRYGAVSKAYRKAHPEMGRVAGHRRRARIIGNGGVHTAKDVARQYEKQDGLCFWCGDPLNGEFQVDHIYPLSLGGTNDPDNIDCACGFCNRSKGNKLPFEWIGMICRSLIRTGEWCV